MLFYKHILFRIRKDLTRFCCNFYSQPYYLQLNQSLYRNLREVIRNDDYIIEPAYAYKIWGLEPIIETGKKDYTWDILDRTKEICFSSEFNFKESLAKDSESLVTTYYIG